MFNIPLRTSALTLLTIAGVVMVGLHSTGGPNIVSRMSDPAHQFIDIDQFKQALEDGGRSDQPTEVGSGLTNDEQLGKSEAKLKKKCKEIKKLIRNAKPDEKIAKDKKLFYKLNCKEDASKKVKVDNDLGEEMFSARVAFGDKEDPDKILKTLHKVTGKTKRDEYWPVKLPPSYGQVFDELDFSAYGREEAEYLKANLQRYSERAKTLSSVCSRNSELEEEPAKIGNLVWDTLHTPNLVWCQISKVASGSWTVNFIKEAESMDGVTAAPAPTIPPEYSQIKGRKSYPHMEVARLYPEPATNKEKNEVFRNAIRFIIVRHPFVRLVSAYRGKMNQDDPKPRWFHYEREQQFIIDKYRPENSQINSTHPTFSEFARYVLDQSKGIKSAADWKGIRCWKPMHQICPPCRHDYQLILKIETLQEDTEFVATLSHLESLKQGTEWLHLNSGSSSDAVALDLFKELTKSQAQQLYNVYKLDFDLFGYSPEEFISAAQDES